MEELAVIGKSIKKIDAFAKVTGEAQFTTDVKLPRMLHAKILRSPFAHAKITKINTSKAEKLKGVRAVATGKDAPDERLYMLQDRYVLARNVVRFVGEPVAAVAADTVEIAEEALNLIDVEYEELPAIFDPEEAMKPNPRVVVPDISSRFFSPQYQGRDPAKAPVNVIAAKCPNILAYSKVRKGDVDSGFKKSDLIVEDRYVRPRVQHCPMEPNAAVVRPESDGGVTVWATTQTPYPEREVISRVFNLPVAKVRIIALSVGGGFGSRVEGLGVSIHITVLLAIKAKRPVKLVYERSEVFIDGVTEMPQVINIKDGFKKDGTLVAREMKIVLNAGAYSGNNLIGAYNSGWAAGGTYQVPNFKCDSYVVATNEPVSGPFRGFGANPPIWAVECHMDLVAEKLGIDPVDIRRKNILKENGENGVGETVTNIQLADSIDKVVKLIKWDKKPQQQKGPWRKGLGIALSNKFTTGHFPSSVTVKINPDAGIEVRHSAVDLGQGCNTALTQIAAEEFATSPDKIKIISADTLITPPDHGTISNRVTWHTGNALRLACQDLKRRLFELASVMLKMPPGNLVIEDGLIHKKGTTAVGIKVADLFVFPMRYQPQDGELLGRGVYVSPVIGPDPETGLSKRVVSYYSWGACTVEIAVNIETGQVKVIRVIQSFDMGRPLNPAICDGQSQGGAGMGIGSALFEKMIIEDGIVINPNFIDYRIPSIMEIPTENLKVMSAKIVPHPEGPFGAKGFAEGGLIPTPPAIANAIADAIGVRIKELPITREAVLKAIKGTQQAKKVTQTVE